MMFRINKTGYFYFILIIIACTTSCTQINVFEKSSNIPGYKWQNNFAATGTFNIDDTIATYNLYLVLRHTDAYAYNNIWLNVGLQSPGDSLYFQKIDLSLGNDAIGWEGLGMNDIWEIRKPLAQNKRFRKKGQYNFSIFQIMRDNPLPNFMSAGLRVEKVN